MKYVLGFLGILLLPMLYGCPPPLSAAVSCPVSASPGSPFSAYLTVTDDQGNSLA
jgi:hypothetical protein